MAAAADMMLSKFPSTAVGAGAGAVNPTASTSGGTVGETILMQFSVIDVVALGLQTRTRIFFGLDGSEMSPLVIAFAIAASPTMLFTSPLLLSLNLAGSTTPVCSNILP
jgi:hypothetical protein